MSNHTGYFYPLLLIVSSSGPAATVPGESLDPGFTAARLRHYDQALEQWQPLAERGDAEAQYRLGALFQNGRGVPQDYSQALTWFQAAAGLGHVRAQFELGLMHEKGWGVPANPAQARIWYEKAASQGYAMARKRLETMSTAASGENPASGPKTGQSDTALHRAARRGDSEAVRDLLARGVDIDALDKKGRTPYMLALEAGCHDITRILAAAGAEPRRLMRAPEGDRKDRSKRLPPRLVPQDDIAAYPGWPPLTVAAWRGNSQTVELLLARGASVDARAPDGHTALTRAAWNGLAEIVKTLLSHGADVDTASPDGRTALIWAAMEGHTETVKVLAAEGAKLDAMDKDGNPALAWAAQHGKASTVRTLLGLQADAGLARKDGRNALMLATAGGIGRPSTPCWRILLIRARLMRTAIRLCGWPLTVVISGLSKPC